MTDLNGKENLERQIAHNSMRIQELVSQQYNMEITRSLMLCFSSPDESCARSLTKALFAKGTRIVDRTPELESDGRWHIRVGVKRSLRDAVREDFVADLVATASSMHGSYDGWHMLTELSTDPIPRCPPCSHAPLSSTIAA